MEEHFKTQRTTNCQGGFVETYNEPIDSWARETVGDSEIRDNSSNTASEQRLTGSLIQKRQQYCCLDTVLQRPHGLSAREDSTYALCNHKPLGQKLHHWSRHQHHAVAASADAPRFSGKVSLAILAGAGYFKSEAIPAKCSNLIIVQVISNCHHFKP